jgi:Spy/CpxP family protein refolding chaperone
MRTNLLKVTAILAVMSAFVAAQQRQPHDPAEMVQHHVEHLTKALSLTTQQQQQATTIFTEAQNSSKPLHDQLSTAHDNLHAAVQKNDTAAIEQISNTIGNLMAQQTMAHAKAMAAFYQTLTPEQQSKFSQMAEHHGSGMHKHGWHGGPPPGASFK